MHLKDLFHLRKFNEKNLELFFLLHITKIVNRTIGSAVMSVFLWKHRNCTYRVSKTHWTPCLVLYMFLIEKNYQTECDWWLECTNDKFVYL